MSVSAAPLLPTILVETAASHPKRPALIFLENGDSESKSVSYAELLRQALGVAAALGPGARGRPVLLAFPPGPDFAAALFGCFFAGAAGVPTPSLHPGPWRRLARMLSAMGEDTSAEFGLSTADYVQRLSEAVPSAKWLPFETAAAAPPAQARTPQRQDLAVLQYTSGSSAEPKGVEVTHGNLAHNVSQSRIISGHDEGAVIAGWLPHFHDMGLVSCILQAVATRGTLAFMPPASFAAAPLRWARLAEKYGAQIMIGPNFSYGLLAEKAGDNPPSLRTLRVAFNGAEPVRAQTIERFPAAYGLGDVWRPCYGMAESTLAASARRSDEKVLVVRVDRQLLEDGKAVESSAESAAAVVGCGRPIGGMEILIVDPRTRMERGPDEIGEIWLRGESVARGYWTRPELTRERFAASTSDGRGPYFRTGDTGFFKSGQLFPVGRLSDLVIVDGRNIHAEDLEWSAAEAESSLEPGGCAVTRSQEERVVVFAELRRDAWRKREALAAPARKRVAEHLASEYRVEIERVVLLRPRCLPRTTSGKARRAETLRLWLAAELGVLDDEAPAFSV